MKIIECPRDAMQGLHNFIPTDKKAEYINQLLKVGFDTIDFGSFVSPKAIPQMRDTAEVLEKLELSGNSSKLLAIVANQRGAEDAVKFDEISYLGFPLSISETFQQRNTNKSIAQALEVLADIQNLSEKSGKQVVTYISMGFGNPYDDPYDVEVVGEFVGKLKAMGVKIVSLADTIGVSNKKSISYLFKNLTSEFPELEFGAHLHSTRETALEKIAASYESGCRRFDGAIKGFGGCPMAKDELVGNLPTELLINYLAQEIGLDLKFDSQALERAYEMAGEVFVASQHTV
jgi:hydroxymethylglutaryl-CoA lyase